MEESIQYNTIQYMAPRLGIQKFRTLDSESDVLPSGHCAVKDVDFCVTQPVNP